MQSTTEIVMCSIFVHTYAQIHTFFYGFGCAWVTKCVMCACASFWATVNAVYYCYKVITYTFYHIMWPFLIACHSIGIFMRACACARDRGGRPFLASIILTPSLPYRFCLSVFCSIWLYLFDFQLTFFRFQSSESHENWVLIVFSQFLACPYHHASSVQHFSPSNGNCSDTVGHHGNIQTKSMI